LKKKRDPKAKAIAMWSTIQVHPVNSVSAI
jgi:hypothetical protein